MKLCKFLKLSLTVVFVVYFLIIVIGDMGIFYIHFIHSIPLVQATIVYILCITFLGEKSKSKSQPESKVPKERLS